MKVYAHRANLDGPGTGDNRREAIQECLRSGIGVEVDVWGIEGELWVGHDEPAWKLSDDLASSPDVMCHAKNVEAVTVLRNKAAQFFCLDRDLFALCSNGLIWANYGCEPTPWSVMCSPELVGAPESIEQFWPRVARAYGVCTDFPRRYRELQSRAAAIPDVAQ